MMKKSYFILEHRNSDAFNRLRLERDSLKLELAALLAKYNDLSMRYGVEIYTNNELCDLCRANGISFRPALDRAKKRGGY